MIVEKLILHLRCSLSIWNTGRRYMIRCTSSHHSLSLFKKEQDAYCKQVNLKTGRRFLMNPEVLGIKCYQRDREKFRKHSRLPDFIRDTEQKLKDPEYVITQEDLAKLIHVVETDSEIDICVKATKRYGLLLRKHLKKGQPLGSIKRKGLDFNFAPVVLRMLHYKRKTAAALQLFDDESLKECFTHLTNYTIMLDLLYESGMYEKVEEYYKIVFDERKKQLQYGLELAFGNHTVIYLAALYRMNTQKSLHKAVKLFRDLEGDGCITSRCKAIGALLAYNQNEKELALEIINLYFASFYPGSFNTGVRMFILAKLGRAEEAFNILESYVLWTQEGEGDIKKYKQVFPDCVEAVKEAVNKGNNLQLKRSFIKLQEELAYRNLIHSKTMFQLLLGPIQNSNRQIYKFKYNKLYAD